MLKPPDRPAEPQQERDFGDLVRQLLDDAKAYARAEADLARAIAADKAKSLRGPVILLVAALLLGMGAINALCIGILLGFNALMSPVLAGICACVLTGAIAALLAWIGVSKLRDWL